MSMKIYATSQKCRVELVSKKAALSGVTTDEIQIVLINKIFVITLRGINSSALSTGHLA